MRPENRRVLELFCQNPGVTKLAEERRFCLFAYGSNLHQFFEDTDSMPSFNRGVETGKWTGLLLFVDQRRVNARLQR